MTTIGITTTVPIEVLLAAGYNPVDLNNVYVTDPNPDRLVNIAERDGFPINCCAWIKGIYGVVMERGIENVLCVTTGDCSNTIMLMEVFKLKGLNTIPFAYPDQPDVARMKEALESLSETLGTTLDAAERFKKKLEKGRGLAHELDGLTWREGLVSGWENHLWLVSTSDFNGDYLEYERQLSELIAESRGRKPYPEDMLRIAYIGVPSVFGRDLYRTLEQNGARVVFNEIQRQFAMPTPGRSLAEQYSSYTYPYSIFDRLEDIKAELGRRRVQGVIHYVQAFCHRGIGDIIIRHSLDLPVLTIEGNDEYVLNQHLMTRVEAFIDMLRRRERISTRAK